MTEHNLDHLDTEFSQTKIEAVIKSLPNNHAPRPDGFNGLFIKKSWDIIKGDFLRLFRDFYHQNTDLKSVNSSIITLIPKKNNPETIYDCWGSTYGVWVNSPSKRPDEGIMAEA